MNSCIACFFATEIEAKPLIKKLKIISKTYLRSSSFLLGYSPFHSNLKFLIVQSGIGTEAATQAAKYAFDHYPINEAWVFGFAAATSNHLTSGDTLIATEIGSLNTPKEKWIATDRSLRTKAIDICSQIHQFYAEGIILTSTEVIHKKEDKLRIGLEQKSIGLEMEAFPIASIAQAKNVPIIEIRWVIDEAEYTLPKVENFVGESGKWKPLSTFSSFIQNPKLLLELPSFLWKVIQTSKSMEHFLKGWLNQENKETQ